MEVFRYLHSPLMMRKGEATHQALAVKTQGLDSDLYLGDFGFDYRQGHQLS
jgi:hypothetical protein